MDFDDNYIYDDDYVAEIHNQIETAKQRYEDYLKYNPKTNNPKTFILHCEDISFVISADNEYEASLLIDIHVAEYGLPKDKSSDFFEVKPYQVESIIHTN